MNLDLQDREKNILAALSVIIVAALYWYIFKPSFEKKDDLNKQIRQIQSGLRNPKINEEKLKEKEQGVETLKKQIKTLLYQIPLTEKRGFLIRDIEDLAGENKIEIVSFVPKEAVQVTMTGKEITRRMKRYKRRSQMLEEQHAKVLKTVINIEANGKFSNLNKFFADVITYYRAVEVTDLIMTRAGSSAERGEDKRFAQKRRNDDPLEDAKNTNLSVSFTLLAYTSLAQD